MDIKVLPQPVLSTTLDRHSSTLTNPWRLFLLFILMNVHIVSSICRSEQVSNYMLLSSNSSGLVNQVKIKVNSGNLCLCQEPSNQRNFKDNGGGPRE